MKFNSRKDPLFQLVTFGVSMILCVVVFMRITSDTPLFGAFLLGDIVGVLVVAYLLWVYFDTSYELTETSLKYKSGLIRGSISTDSIRKVIKGKSLWSGIKPATARKGLIIKYKDFQEIYISPETNDSFVEKLLEFNKDVEITTP
ncbi:PH (Pleckstrin Homology) domain-containing protein [Nonlabens dokdonensis]|jgi:hypothetical protein|uniref:DUF1200 domain containing protein n=2 Tax=Nonlabens dokdonensis TaxID=328515 RepID=L7W6S1_NONDD|nr:PH domain-containing protein [Nonlabens dokdonensis]AGC77370.1 DUF1200 domain containing protein [Nonlabens dokdonensis DSW-6]PZX40896.1 PH (Pleckstrin Homology) domain-containing protein [Nonlabens dokdonensis]